MDGKYGANVKQGDFDADKTCVSVDQVLHLGSEIVGSVSKPFPDASTTVAATNQG